MRIDRPCDLGNGQTLGAAMVKAKLGNTVQVRIGLGHKGRRGRGRIWRLAGGQPRQRSGMRERVRVPHLLGEHQQKRQQHTEK